MNDGILLEERRGKVLLLTLNRPQRRNALHPDLIAEIKGALDRAAMDDGTRVIILTGAGSAFCAGLDLHHLAGLDEEGSIEYMRSAFTLFRTIYELKQPTLAAVNGPAMAGGFDLAAFCDFRFCSAGARFAQTEILLGLTQIMSPVHHLVGLSRAKELAMSGKAITADEAFRIGLADRVFSSADLLNESLQYAAALAGRPPEALFETKRLSRAMVGEDPMSAVDHMLETITSRLRSNEHRSELRGYLNELGRRRDSGGSDERTG